MNFYERNAEVVNTYKICKGKADLMKEGEDIYMKEYNQIVLYESQLRILGDGYPQILSIGNWKVNIGVEADRISKFVLEDKKIGLLAITGAFIPSFGI